VAAFSATTPRLAGASRSTRSHIDPFGSLILPAMETPRVPGARVGEAGTGEPGADATPTATSCSSACFASNFVLMVMRRRRQKTLFDPASVPPSFGLESAARRDRVLVRARQPAARLFNLLIPPLDGSTLEHDVVRVAAQLAQVRRTVSSCCSSSCSPPG
jgi:hypothetical protein